MLTLGLAEALVVVNPQEQVKGAALVQAGEQQLAARLVALA